MHYVGFGVVCYFIWFGLDFRCVLCVLAVLVVIFGYWLVCGSC